MDLARTAYTSAHRRRMAIAVANHDWSKLCVQRLCDFWPGRIVMFEWFTDPNVVWDRKGERPTVDEFYAADDARPRRLEYFAIFATNAEFSTAVRIHYPDPSHPEEPPRPAEHQAVIYTGPEIPTAEGTDTPPANPPIQVRPYGHNTLPQGSRLDYSDLFIVEHTFELAFVGAMTIASWPVFAGSYCKVQNSIGNDVQIPIRTPSCEDTLKPHSHKDIEFFPGLIVKALYQTKLLSGWSGTGKRFESYEEFVKWNRARRSVGYFAMFTNWDNCSMAVPIRVYDPEANKPPSDHRAPICMESWKSSTQALNENLADGVIRVKPYGDEKLPEGSQLDYSSKFCVDHYWEMTFLGQIDPESWPAFESTYRKIQTAMGYNVEVPDPDAGRPKTYEVEEWLKDPGDEPDDSGPEARVQTEHVAVAGAGWFGITSEPPLHPPG